MPTCVEIISNIFRAIIACAIFYLVSLIFILILSPILGDMCGDNAISLWVKCSLTGTIIIIAICAIAFLIYFLVQKYRGEQSNDIDDIDETTNIYDSYDSDDIV